jgi:hypothetical protein
MALLSILFQAIFIQNLADIHKVHNLHPLLSSPLGAQ